MKKTNLAIAIFAKNPKLSRVKTRLCSAQMPDLGGEFLNLSVDCIKQTITELKSSLSTEEILLNPYLTVAEKESMDCATTKKQWECYSLV